MQSKHHIAIQSAYETFIREIEAHTDSSFHRTEALQQASSARYWAIEGAKDKHLNELSLEELKHG